MYKKILLAYDGSPEYRAALRQGAEIAEFCKAETHLLAVITSSTTMPIAGGVNPSDLVNEEQREIRSYLDEGVERLRAMGFDEAAARAALRRNGDDVARAALALVR